MLFQSTLPLRFWRKLYADPSGCWLWQGTRNADGYGFCRIGGVRRGVHQWAYEAFKGAIPDGFELDHLCRNPGCANPLDLEAVTHRINVLRGDGPLAQLARSEYCEQGHPYDLLNTLYVRGHRRCRICRAENWQRYKAKRQVEGRWPRHDPRYPKKAVSI